MTPVNKAVFLDRDGVINKLVRDDVSGTYESPYSSSDMELEDSAIEALKQVRNLGYLIIVVSNQPAVAKGNITMESLKEIEQRFLDLLDQNEVEIDRCLYSYTHPHGVVPSLTCESYERKPEPGMILKAAKEYEIDVSQSWVVGDSDIDIEAGFKAGCQTILVENPRSDHRRHSSSRPDAHVKDIMAAAEHISASV